VNVIGCAAVPIAESVPFTISVRLKAFPWTVTPGSMVSVTPEATVTSPVRT
jgi:hypothetical protein